MSSTVYQERDALKAALKEWEDFVHDATGENECHPRFIAHKIAEIEAVIDDASAEVARLKADKARLELQTHPLDLERKLTLCRGALSAIESTAENAAIGTDPDNEQAIALNNICDTAQEALADTESKK